MTACQREMCIYQAASESRWKQRGHPGILEATVPAELASEHWKLTRLHCLRCIICSWSQYANWLTAPAKPSHIRSERMTFYTMLHIARSVCVCHEKAPSSFLHDFHKCRIAFFSLKRLSFDFKVTSAAWTCVCSRCQTFSDTRMHSGCRWATRSVMWRNTFREHTAEGTLRRDVNIAVLPGERGWLHRAELGGLEVHSQCTPERREQRWWTGEVQLQRRKQRRKERKKTRNLLAVPGKHTWCTSR